ncbi:MAG TPA: fused MFS/spermidine synthase, partial [Verrucomicrobiae bacterium]|nr:fused MFS/spermidine synthase [Verrucomicrobiae bacterium]
SSPPRGLWAIYLATGLSGFCALSCEVIWTRLLSLMLGSTTYSFSLIIAVFLLGLGLGSAVAGLLRLQSKGALIGLGVSQLFLAGGIAWAAFALARSLPYWPINASASKSVWFDFQLDIVRCLWAILPATCLWGASFPLALSAVVQPGSDPGRLVGRFYAVNTLGAILGAVCSSLVLIPSIGTSRAQQLLIVVCSVAAVVVLLTSSTARPNTLRVTRRTLVALAAGAAAAFLALCVPSLPWDLVAYGRYLPMKTELGKVLYVAEGMNSSVAVTEMESGVRNFHVSGKIEASTDQQDMRLQRMLCHVPALFHPEPRSVLVVGCGAGVTAGSFLTHPAVQRVTLCEIEPLIPRAVARFFGQENYDVVADPRVRIVYDDARHYILTTREKFDIITSDPIHPWVKGAAALYTREYFEMCKKHLKSGGMVTQWVPLYESDLATVKSEIATFFDVFPQGTIWSNDDMGSGYDLVLLGQVEPLEVDVGAVQQRLSREDHRLVAQSLRDVGIRSAFALAATYEGQASDLKPWLRGGQINRDRDLRLQYLAGMGLNVNQSDLIYEDMSFYRRFPGEIFIGSNIWNDALRRNMQPQKTKGKKQ